MSNPAPHLTDGQILLRPLTDADADDHLAGEDDEQVRWLSGRPATIESVRAWIARNERDWREQGPRRNFGIVDVVSDALVGNIEAQLDLPDLAPGEANIAYAVFPSWRGRGIATRAVRLVTGWLATVPSVRTVLIRVHPDNATSLVVARLAGYSNAGIVTSEDGTPMQRFEWSIHDHQATGRPDRPTALDARREARER
jgi:RimJ/RimL family protein N-acetyltransferase